MRSSQTTHLALPLHHPRVCSSASSTPVHNVSYFLHLLLKVCAKQGMFQKFHVDQRCVDSFSQLTLAQRLGDWIFLGKHESSWYMQCEFQFLDRSWNIMKEEEEVWGPLAQYSEQGKTRNPPTYPSHRRSPRENTREWYFTYKWPKIFLKIFENYVWVIEDTPLA